MEHLFPISSWEEAPAKTSAWLENVKDWVEREVDSSTNNAELLMTSEPHGWCGKMSLALSPATEEKTSPRCSEDSPETDRLFPLTDGAPVASVSVRNVSQFGACLTLRTSESHSDAVACSLSLVLEPWRDELLRFCLSQKAATGILRRAVNRGRTLPPRLADALEHLAGGGLTEVSQTIQRGYPRNDLETDTFILETGEPLQDVIGTLSVGSGCAGPSTVNGQDAYTGQLVPVNIQQVTNSGGSNLGDITQPILRYYGQGSDLDTQSWVVESSPVNIHENQRSEISLSDRASAITLGGGEPGQGYAAVMHESPIWTGSAQQDGIAAPLLAEGNGRGLRTTDIDGATWSVHKVNAGSIVRRLTPLECERLMGWPDGWTAEGITDDGETVEIATTNRYRICGNGIVGNVTEWIGNRLPAEATETKGHAA